MSDKARIIKASSTLLSSIQKTTEKVEWENFIEFADLLPRVRRTYVSGAGRSGLVARSFGMRLMHAGLLAFIPGETITPAIEEQDLLVAISCTGETGYTSYLARRAKEFGASVIAITSNKDSTIASIADKTLVIPAIEENIVLQAAVFEHTASLCLDALFNVLSEKLKVDSVEFWKRHANLE